MAFLEAVNKFKTTKFQLKCTTMNNNLQIPKALYAVLSVNERRYVKSLKIVIAIWFLC